MEGERKIKRAKEREKTRGDWGRGRAVIQGVFRVACVTTLVNNSNFVNF